MLSVNVGINSSGSNHGHQLGIFYIALSAICYQAPRFDKLKEYNSLHGEVHSEEPNINDSGTGFAASSSNLSVFSSVYFDALPLGLDTELDTLDHDPDCYWR